MAVSLREPVAVSGFTTSDGEFFSSEIDADKHQLILDFKKWCEDNICIGGEWNAAMVANEILDHWKIEPISVVKVVQPVVFDDDIPF